MFDLLKAAAAVGTASDSTALPPDIRPIHNFVLAIRAIWAQIDAPSDTETTNVPGDELRNLLLASDGRISVEQLPLGSLGYHAVDVSELLTHPNSDQAQDTRLKHFAFNLRHIRQL